MDITDKTWEEIFKEIVLNHGQIGIMIVLAILSLVIGGGIVWLYLTKVKYKLTEYNLTVCETDKQNLESELSKAKETITQLEADNKRLRNEHKDVNDYRHVRQAVKRDEKDVSLQEFTKQ